MRVFTLLVTLSLLLAVSITGAQNGVTEPQEYAYEVQMTTVPMINDPIAEQLAKEQLADWLVTEAAQLPIDQIVSIKVTQEELDDIRNYECVTCGQNQKLKVGVTKPVGMISPKRNGAVRQTPDGGFVWTIGFECESANGLRVHVKDLMLPEGAQLYTYNYKGEAFGPHTAAGPNNDGDFWTEAISGPIAYLQIHASADVSLDSLDMHITDVAYLGEKFRMLMEIPEETPEDLSTTMAHCPNNASCIQDAACYSSSDFPGYNTVTNGVAHILFQMSGSWYMCSGGLMNSNPVTYTPYFLTANHCVGNQTIANTVQTYFFYKNSYCGQSPCVTRGTATNNGATLLSTSATCDYSFMRLNGSAPGGSSLLGWTTGAVAYSNGTMLYRLSHPAGSPQAFSKHRVDTSRGTCSSWPRGNWIYSTDTLGATEGGSSGSPVCNSSGQVVGQLSGACGWFPQLTCYPSINATVDGAFANYFNSVKQWLCPGC